MVLFWIGAAVLLLALLLTAGLYLFIYFNHPDKHKKIGDCLSGHQYQSYSELFLSYIKQIKEWDHKRVFIRSYDGKKLSARIYENVPGAPVAILMHGYRAEAMNDFAGILPIIRKMGYTIVLVDERACGKSEGVTITFGIKERKDCMSWIRYVLKHYGPDTKILLYGVSMGAATVMMASSLGLPQNVEAIIEDCGFTTPKDIIMKTAADMGLPAKFLYPFARIGAWLFGGFDVESASPIDSVSDAKVPILFIHGYQDGFVPYSMGSMLYDACSGPKRMETFERGEHAVSVLSDPWKYESVVSSFIKGLHEEKA
jgi:fermentation-respiration switch protein FrsA (DUF1100 family)